MLYERIPGETIEDRFCRIARDMAGCSLLANKPKLQEFIRRLGVEAHPEEVVLWSTNCAVFMLCLMFHAAGEIEDARAIHPLLAEPLVNTTEFTVLVRICNDLGLFTGAWTSKDALPKASFLWYRLAGTNDDHAELAMEQPDEHGGGGRDHNAITCGHSDDHWSWGRPIHNVAVFARCMKWTLAPALPNPGGPADDSTASATPAVA